MAAAKPKLPALSQFRNLGVIAHIDAGKTTTTEHLLYYAGVKRKLGAVDEGTTETDFDQEEQERGITIYSACIPFPWRDCTINLIDTPGHVDFTAEVERSLRVLDGAVVVFDAQKGVEAQSETVWHQADKYGVPRLVFVNKMDVVGANFSNVLTEIRERLEGVPVPLTIPIGSGSVKDSPTPFAGVIDLIEQKALFFGPADGGKTVRAEPIPAELAGEVARYREALFDQLTKHDEQDRLTSAILEGQEVAPELIRQVLREQTLRRRIQPVLCGSGREHIGIQPLLDAVTWYLPSPLDRPPVVGTNPRKPDKEEKRKPDPKEPFCGLVFKVVSHPSAERAFVRIYSGSLKGNTRLYNPGKDYKENVGKLYHVHADPKTGLEEVAEAPAGDIVVVLGMKESVTGDTLCETQHPILLEPIVFAEAVVSQSVEPESTADKQKLIDTLTALRREDPTFLWRADPETGQTLMSGMGTLHLEVKRHRMERDFRLKVRVGQPRVSYRETLGRPTTVVGECLRPAGTTAQFAKLTVTFTPHEGKENDPPVLVTSRIGPETLPVEFLAAAEQGLRDGLLSGELGYPVLHVKAEIVGAEVDPQISTPNAFVAAAADAVNKGFRDNSLLLEPIMALEVDTPDEFVGPVMADLMARRGEVDVSDFRGNRRIIRAKVPLAKLFDYADKVRSLTQGRASSTMAPHAYHPAPDEVRRGFLYPDEVG